MKFYTQFKCWGQTCISLKFLLVMKLIIVFLITAFLQVSLAGYAQKITLSEKNASLEQVLRQIRSQTGYNILCDADLIKEAQPVDIQVKNARIEEALEKCLAGQALTYTIKNNTVIVQRKPVPSQTQVPPGIIKGKVSDNKGITLPGVTIKLEGAATQTTATDANGNYSFTNLPAGSYSLSFTYLGFTRTRRELSLKEGQESLIDVSLMEEAGSLEEVVVMAYGVQKKVSVTGAVSSIGTKELRQSSSANLAAALAGRLSGLTSIQSGGGQPGRDDATMYLRGASTTNGRSPLILIDGVPRDNIRTIDANEVASVSILKDASATALFGVRGANGVILITTKRGVEGKPELTINTEQSYSSFTREPERLHSLDYMKLRNEASANDNISPLPFSQAVMDKYANPLLGLDPADPDYAQKAKVRNYMYPDHDYYRELISRYSPSTRINANTSGGTDRVSYFVNAAYLHQGGNMKTEPKSVLGYDPAFKMDRFNFRGNLDYKVTNSLKSFLNIGSYIEQMNLPTGSGYYNNDTETMMSYLFQRAQSTLPISPGPTTIDGFGVPPGQLVIPEYLDRTAFAIINRLGYQNVVRSNLNSSFGLDWDLGNTVTKGLSMKGMISYDSKSTTTTRGAALGRFYLAEVDPATDRLSYAVIAEEALLSLSKVADSRYNINMQASVNYNRTFGGKHNIGGMILGQRDYWETPAGEIPFNVLGVAARATYAYDNRYLAELNMGYNGSEQFAPGKRYGFFPAVSAGWVVSNENFLKEHSIITSLKFRASYGKVGNDQMGNARFLYQSNITLGGGPLGSLGLGRGISQGLVGNPNISWEVAKKQNYGVDLQLLKSLDISFDYFLENRSSILISRGTVPEFQGVLLSNIPRVNMGLVDNRGYEIELTYKKPLAKDLSLMLRGNYGYNHNIVKFADEVIRDESFASRYIGTGYPLGQSFGYKIDYSNGNGYFNSRQELDDYLAKTTYNFGKPRVGDFKYLDLNGDGIISDKDLVAIGNSSIPGVSYGLALNLQYKSFDFTTFFQGVGRYSSNYAGQGGVYEYNLRGSYFGYHKSAWTPERYANGEKITYPALSIFSNTNHVSNDFFIMDRSFIRLKNIELAYSLPKGALKVLGVQSLRVYVSAQNLFTWDNLRMGHLDPENNNPTGYPQIKMTNFGMNLTF